MPTGAVDVPPAAHGHARRRSSSCSTPLASSSSPPSSLIARMLIVTTAFALASLCYYAAAVVVAPDTGITTRHIPLAARHHDAQNLVVFGHVSKLSARESGYEGAPLLEESAALPPQVLEVTPSREQLPMAEAFYSSAAASDDMSTTIIFNVFKGEPRALELQLTAAAQQEKLTSMPEVWVMCFASPRQREYEKIVAKFRDESKLLPNLVFTASNFNHKFHGRFLLAYMAKTKYVLIVDDDKMIDSTTVFDYIQYMRKTPGVWGNNGHLRGPTFSDYKSWPTVGYDLSVQDMAEQDYLSGMWFLQQSWLEYFVKERLPTWETSEDMHLSHVMRKYLNLNTYGGKVALKADKLPKKKHAATVGSALELREFVFDHQLGRGNKVANVVSPIKTLVYAETVEDIEDLLAKIQSCRAEIDIGGEDSHVSLRGAATAAEHTNLGVSDNDAVTAVVVDDDEEQAPWCSAGKTAVVFRGAAEQDVVRMIAAAEKLCGQTECEYLSVKPKIKHPIRYFNMREGFGQANIDIPWQTSVSDVITSLVGVLNNVQPQQFLFPDVGGVRWKESAEETGAVHKRSRMQIYHNAVRLALQIHANSPTNQKWDLRDLSDDSETAFPNNVRMFAWRKSPLDSAPMVEADREREANGVEGGEPLYQEFSFFE